VNAADEETTQTVDESPETYSKDEAKKTLARLCTDYPKANYKSLKDVVARGPEAVRYFENILTVVLKSTDGTKGLSGRTVAVINEGDEDARLKQTRYANELTETVYDEKRGRVRFTHAPGDPVAGNPLARHGFSSINIKKGTAMRLPEEVAEIVKDSCRQPLKLEYYDPKKHAKYFKTAATYDTVGTDPSYNDEDPEADPDIKPDADDRTAYAHGAPKPGFVSAEVAEGHGIHIPDGPLEGIPVKSRRSK